MLFEPNRSQKKLLKLNHPIFRKKSEKCFFALMCRLWYFILYSYRDFEKPKMTTKNKTNCELILKLPLYYMRRIVLIILFNSCMSIVQ